MSVYFARVGDYVKIGTSTRVAGRLGDIKSDVSRKPEDLDTSQRIDLLADIPGDRSLEAWVHEDLAALRVAGEWFRDGAELRDYLSGDQLRKRRSYWEWCVAGVSA